MLKIVKIIAGFITIALAGYGLITKNFAAQPIMLICLAIFILTIGVNELQKDKKWYGYINIAVAFLILISVILPLG